MKGMKTMKKMTSLVAVLLTCMLIYPACAAIMPSVIESSIHMSSAEAPLTVEIIVVSPDSIKDVRVLDDAGNVLTVQTMVSHNQNRTKNYTLQMYFDTAYQGVLTVQTLAANGTWIDSSTSYEVAFEVAHLPARNNNAAEETMMLSGTAHDQSDEQTTQFNSKADLGVAVDQKIRYSSDAQGWNGRNYQYVFFGEYPQEDSDPQPILWRVLSVENDTAFLLSEYALDARPFDNRNPSNWTGSPLRKWLNNSFAYTAFETAEVTGALVEDDKGDKVSLLRISDVVRQEFGFSSSYDAEDRNRIASGTEYAVSNGLLVYSEQRCSYFTRSHSGETIVYQIRADGSRGYAKCTRDNVGIRPVIRINVNHTVIISGDGTQLNPYVIEYEME